MQHTFPYFSFQLCLSEALYKILPLIYHCIFSYISKKLFWENNNNKKGGQWETGKLSWQEESDASGNTEFIYKKSKLNYNDVFLNRQIVEICAVFCSNS